MDLDRTGYQCERDNCPVAGGLSLQREDAGLCGAVGQREGD